MMTLTRIVRAAATVALAAALLVTQAGTAFAGAQPGNTLSGYPTIDNTMTVSNESWSDVLNGWGNSERNKYHCGDYHKIVTPDGVASAYPYGTSNWGRWFGYPGWTSEADRGEAVTLHDYDLVQGELEIQFSNVATTKSTNKIRFDCTSIYPEEQVQTITVQSPTAITPTTATIHASVDVLWGAQVCGWGAWVEYGSDTGSYEQLEVMGFGGQMNSTNLALPAVTLTGLSPGTSYHYRVDFGQIVDCSHKPSPYYHSYSSPSNTFTTAVSPQAGGTYGIASFADGRAFIDVPGSRPTVGQNLWLYEGNGTSAQQWSLLSSRARDGYFKIVSGVDGLCLEIRGGSIPDAPIDQYTCDVNAPDQPNQLWQPVQQADGSFLLKSKGGLLLSSAGGTANATGLVARTPTAAPTATQKWSFIPPRAATLRAKRPKRRTKRMRCRGTARRCQALVGIAGGAVNRKIIIRLPSRNMRVQSVKAVPRRMQRAYSFSEVDFKPRRRRLVVILNAAEWIPAGSHLIVKFKAPRQRDRQRRRR